MFDSQTKINLYFVCLIFKDMYEIILCLKEFEKLCIINQWVPNYDLHLPSDPISDMKIFLSRDRI